MKQLLNKLEAVFRAMTLIANSELERGLQIRSKAAKSRAGA